MVVNTPRPYFVKANTVNEAIIKAAGTGVTACFTADRVVMPNGDILPSYCYYGCNRNNWEPQRS